MHVARTALGSTALEVGRIGLGCLGMTGAYDLGHLDDASSVATIQRALDLGADFLDTGDSYGLNNELLVGRAVRARREQAFIAGKVGIVGRFDRQHRVNGRPDHIRRALEESLHRLRTDYLDLYQLQAVDPAVPLEETWGAMADLLAEGKVRTLGVVSDDTAVVARLQQVFPVTVVTAPLSLFDPARRPLAAWAAGHGVALTASAPLGRGLLAATMPPSPRFAPTDIRSRLPEWAPDRLRERHALTERVRSVARRIEATPAQVALAWVMAQGGTTIPLPGTRHVQHLEENVRAADVVLDAELLADLDALADPAAAAE